MAIEIRRLMFTYPEAMSAIAAYGEKNNIDLPVGKIIRAQFAGNAEYDINPLKQMKSELQSDYNIKDNPRSVILTIFSTQTLEQKYLNLTSNFISIALIEYCIQHKIMLPKDAEKSLDFSDFSICLDINKNAFTAGDSHDDRLTLSD
jgi:hypothetical protein